MKSVCPHCNQEFPDVPNEYLGWTLECSTCKKTFVCQEAKICNACGKTIAQTAVQCYACGNVLNNIHMQTVQAPAAYTQAPAAYTQAPAAYTQAPVTYTQAPVTQHSAADECCYDKVDGFSAWVRCFRYGSRASRKEFFSFLGLTIFATIILQITPFMTKANDASLFSIIAWILYLLAVILDIAAFFVYMPLAIRRVHDTGMQWWTFLLLYMPVIWLGVALCPSQPGRNKYGLNPIGLTPKGKYSILINLLIYTGISVAVHIAVIVLLFITVFLLQYYNICDIDNIIDTSEMFSSYE